MNSEIEKQCLVYNEGADTSLEADLYLPGENANRAAVVCIHGGGWSAGKRDLFSWHSQNLAARGFVVLNLSYRLSGVAKFPAALEDCREGVRFLRRQSQSYGIDSDKIGAMGSSAGGHLAACLGSIAYQNEEDESSRVQCVVDIHGLHDLTRLHDHKIYGCCLEFMGHELGDKRDLWVEASPALHVDGRAAPSLLTHAPDDLTVPYEQSVTYATTLMESHIPVEFIPTPGSGHGFFYNPDGEWTKQLWPHCVNWFERHLCSETKVQE